jgi:hypothetical protein
MFLCSILIRHVKSILTYILIFQSIYIYYKIEKYKANVNTTITVIKSMFNNKKTKTNLWTVQQIKIADKI